MIEHKCNICNKQYSSRQSLCNHNRRFHISDVVKVVKVCVKKSVPIVKIVKINSCIYCNKDCKSRQYKWEHQNKFCKKNKPAHSKINNNIIPESNINNIVIPDSKITKNSHNKIINCNNNNNNIIINNYSNDNTEYISEAFIKRMFNHLKNTNEQHIPIHKVIENIKFNPNHKENNNVKITNMRSKVGMKYNDNKWLTVDKNELLNELYKLGEDMLALWAKKDFLTDDIKIYYDRFNKISKKVLKTGIKEELNKTAYIYTKNNDTSLDI